MIQNRSGHENGSAVGFHIVDPHEGAAFFHRHHRGHQGALQALAGRQIQGQADHGFSGCAKKKGIAQGVEPLQMMDGFQIHLIGFAKADARIQYDFVR